MADPDATAGATPKGGAGGAAAAAAPAAPAPPPPAPASALPWLRVPITFQAGSGVPLEEVHGMAPALREAVRSALGFSELFPVQAAVWRELAGGASASHDACICAPTGSGKTLAYALPLLSAVAAARPHAAAVAPASGSGRGGGAAAAARGGRGGGAAAGASPAPLPSGPRDLAALVVLPTRDLAVQVHATLAALAPRLGLVAGLAAAQSSVASEAAAVVGRPAAPGSGRVRVLVVDEADRLLRQDYQNWLPAVLAQLPGGDGAGFGGGDGGGFGGGGGDPAPHLNVPLLPFGQPRPLKLIVSATLTRDPSKLARLQLHCPRFISLAALGGRRYALPPGLRLHRVLAPAQHKPLALVALLHRLKGVPTLVFASSLETTHRLYLLLAALPGLPERVVEYAGRLPASERAANLAAFRRGAARVLVASDAMARGMDVDGVGAVVNYDAPVYPKVFVHRAGRTARAGRAGAVYTLLRPQDMRHFKAVASKLSLPAEQGEQGGGGGGGGGGGAAAGRELRLPQEELAPLRPTLREALQQVQALLAAERSEDASGGGGDGGGGGKRAPPGRELAAEAGTASGGGDASGGGSDGGDSSSDGSGSDEPNKPDDAAAGGTGDAGGGVKAAAQSEHRKTKRRKQV
ncbi:hypothetical protein Rsub_04138 [Raphidocelis subcapitata]|uniref:ATP-dependent RNA helicase n=1 Tax=Raphidocelis subcapitata TaxID=307507 RepID=A0A2V0NUS8_9CHLO|nr:hypothetical protein Rsub_04138 [Raphidocelis subcapitata]|eukprot:GBF91398.1 hypothetical protein Rsub_04138 [Raphidocelis subcapitata]